MVCCSLLTGLEIEFGPNPLEEETEAQISNYSAVFIGLPISISTYGFS